MYTRQSICSQVFLQTQESVNILVVYKPHDNLFPFLSIYLFCQIKGRPGFWPSGIERHMCDGCCHLFLADAMVFRILNMVFQAAVCNALCHKSSDCQKAPGFHIQVFVVPVFPKQHIVIEVRELRRKFPSASLPAV